MRRSPGSGRRSTKLSLASVFTTVVTVPGLDQPRAATSLDFRPSASIRSRSTPRPARLIRRPAACTVFWPNAPISFSAVSIRAWSGASAGKSATSAGQSHAAGGGAAHASGIVVGNAAVGDAAVGDAAVGDAAVGDAAGAPGT